jgi:Na+/H+ antiporter NhaD/arsenite permease-like protein
MVRGMIPAVLIFLATDAVIAFGRAPRLTLDRAGAALLGAALMVAGGVLTLHEAYAAIDMNTIVLLLGMMILVANLRVAGFFALAASWASGRAHRPLVLLAAVVMLSGVLSAFFVNDTVCVMLVPLVAEAALAMKRQVEPYLIALAMASNAGSVATITGNPQNMVIGSVSGVPYTEFSAALAPLALAALAVVAGGVFLFYRREFAGPAPLPHPPRDAEIHPWLLAKALGATAAAIACFFIGFPPAEVAVVAGAALLLTRRIEPQRIWREVDWSLLLMFAGLFIVVRGLEKAAFTPAVAAGVAGLHLNDPAILAGVTAALSNIVSNVPAVLLLKSFVAGLSDPHRAWLVLAMASTFAGNLTITGSVANLIVVERARHLGIEISFWRYLRLGVPVTLVTLALGIAFLG